jgi:septal ring factor EnvC (AmiA/AmiB activator)
MEERFCLVCGDEITLSDWKKGKMCGRCRKLVRKRDKLNALIASLVNRFNATKVKRPAEVGKLNHLTKRLDRLNREIIALELKRYERQRKDPCREYVS